MSNSWTDTAFVVPCDVTEEFEWLEKVIAAYDLFMDEPGGWDESEKDDINKAACKMAKEFEKQEGTMSINLSFARGEGLIFVTSDEGVFLDGVARLFQLWMQKFKKDVPIGFTWAEACSKHIAGAFGGGACFITRKRIRWMSAHGWLEKLIPSTCKIGADGQFEPKVSPPCPN